MDPKETNYGGTNIDIIVSQALLVNPGGREIYLIQPPAILRIAIYLY